MTAPHGNSGTGYLGFRAPSTITLDPNNRIVAGSWVALFKAQDLYPDDFEVWHISVKGPNGSLDVYIDDTFYSTTTRSDRNEYDPKNAMYVRRGQDVSFHFSSSALPRPQVYMFARQPQQGFF